MSARAQSAPQDVDLVVAGGPGNFETRQVLRLEAADIESRTRRWIAFAEKLGAKLGRPALARFAESGDAIEQKRATSLAFPADPLSKTFAPDHSPEALMASLAAMTERAEAAEKAVATAQLKESDAIRATRNAEAVLAKERAKSATLERETERLRALSESSVFALSHVPGELREIVGAARDHAWRAKLLAARADEVAQLHPDALTYPKAHAVYSGETVNRLPHGFGVMVFRDGDAVRATYRGAFENGQRVGHGVATHEGFTWSGEWRGNEACGLGVLETGDGRRFDGEVTPDAEGAPVKRRGQEWGRPRQGEAAHRPAPPALPPPQAAGG